MHVFRNKYKSRKYDYFWFFFFHHYYNTKVIIWNLIYVPYVGMRRRQFFSRFFVFCFLASAQYLFIRILEISLSIHSTNCMGASLYRWLCVNGSILLLFSTWILFITLLIGTSVYNIFNWYCIGGLHELSTEYYY